MSGRRVLLVDDDELVREMVSFFLTESGFDVTTAEGGNDALDIIDKGSFFDVVVSDINMPEMSGLELAQEVKNRDLYIPFILLSGTPNDLTEAKRKELAIAECLLKDANLDTQIVSALKKYIGL
ncbi:response regulator [Candidatus Magnetomonas plexicatena]|uniref:response regulator n=1 Tax=Candidatus Magnetomonas plexicatena TaxID=2552947 RepID=UPI001C761735|nr:response regulator [Nitrospirales bacterium LBB_01]